MRTLSENVPVLASTFAGALMLVSPVSTLEYKVAPGLVERTL